MIVAALSAEPLDVPVLVNRVRSPDAGGIVVFEGTTRSGASALTGAEVIRLEYEAYEKRALRQLHEITTEAQAKWSLESAVAVHRTGLVAIGYPGVLVVAVAKHRAEAFAGCSWIIDTVKTQAAIWKREIYADGTSRWVS